MPQGDTPHGYHILAFNGGASIQMMCHKIRRNAYSLSQCSLLAWSASNHKIINASRKGFQHDGSQLHRMLGRVFEAVAYNHLSPTNTQLKQFNPWFISNACYNCLSGMSHGQSCQHHRLRVLGFPKMLQITPEYSTKTDYRCCAVCLYCIRFSRWFLYSSFTNNLKSGSLRSWISYSLIPAIYFIYRN